MALRDDQAALLQTAIGALHDWQAAAQAAGVLLQQVVLEFPPDDKDSLVQFTWDKQSGKFDLSTLT